MTELRGRLLVGGALVPGRLRLAGERIAEVALEPQARDAQRLPLVAPGAIDLHVHGFGGADESDLAGMARALARAGTTSFLPTLFPDDPQRLGSAAERVWRRAAELDPRAGHARVLGLHLEGPFVSPLAAGALPRDLLATPSVAQLRALLGPATGDGRGVRAVTLAPELPGAAHLVRELARAGVVASFGHSRATAAEARACAGGGRVGATHLYNAMSGVHHREPGLAAFALAGGAAHAELIGDLAHVGEEAVRVAARALGPEALCLVSDALPGAGTGCDAFGWRGREHRVRDGAAWLEGPGGEALAGSATGQLEAVRRLVARGVLGAAEALAMATLAPARALGLEGEVGSLVPGARADLLVLGDDLRLLAVWLAGAPVAGAAEPSAPAPGPSGR